MSVITLVMRLPEKRRCLRQIHYLLHDTMPTDRTDPVRENNGHWPLDPAIQQSGWRTNTDE